MTFPAMPFVFPESWRGARRACVLAAAVFAAPVLARPLPRAPLAAAAASSFLAGTGGLGFPGPAHLVLHDGRSPAARAFGRRAAASGIEVAPVGEDVTAVWQGRLRAAWDGREFTLAGMTAPAVAFCLDLLARDAGYALVHECAAGGIDSPAFASALRAGARLVQASLLPHGAGADGLRAWVIRRRRA